MNSASMKLRVAAAICSALLGVTLASAQCPSIQLPGGVVVYPNGVGFINSEGVAEYQSCHPRPAPRPPVPTSVRGVDDKGHLLVFYGHGAGYSDQDWTAVYEPYGPFPLTEMPTREADQVVPAAQPRRTPTYSGLGKNPLPGAAPGTPVVPAAPAPTHTSSSCADDKKAASVSFTTKESTLSPSLGMFSTALVTDGTAGGFDVDVSITNANNVKTGDLFLGSTLSGQANGATAILGGTVYGVMANFTFGLGDFPNGVVLTLTDPGNVVSNYTGKITLDNPYAPGGCVTGGMEGDPISMATGELIETPSPDLSLGGPLPLVFQRYYSSYLNFNFITGAFGFVPAFKLEPGGNWMHNFDLRLLIAPTNPGEAVTVLLLGGGSVSFEQSQTGSPWQLVFPARRSYQLISANRTYQFLDPDANLIYSFNSQGNLTQIGDRNGNTLTVTQPTAGPGPTEVSDGLGRTLSFTYTNGALTSVQDQSGRTVSYSYTGNDLSDATDANGKTTNFTYATGDLLTKTVRPVGNAPYSQSFDALSRVAQQADSLGNVTTLAYNSGGTTGETVLTDPLSHTFTTVNNPDPLSISSFTDAAGKSGSFTYDSAHRPISFTDRLGNATTFTYDPASGNIASETDAKGDQTTFTYQAQQQAGFTFYNLAKIAFADGTSNSFTYDASGNLLTTTDGAGKITTYTYNSRGQVLTTTNPAGGVDTLTYNSDATPATWQDAAGNVTTYSYDNLKRVAAIQRPDQTSASFTYDALDEVLSVTDERGNVTKLGYDANTNLKSLTDPLNESATFAYDTDDLPASARDPLGNTTQLQYDPLGSVTAVIDAAGEKTTYTYDDLERLTSALDPSGKGLSYTYDAEGRVATVTDALSNTAKLTVDQLGRTTAVASPLGETTAISYDAVSRVTSITDPLSRTARFSYESRGLLSGINAPGSLTTSFTWGNLPVLASFTDPNGNKWPVGYDSLGRLTSITDPLGQALTYSYDNRDRVSSIGSSADSAQIAYDAAGNAVQAKYSDGSSVAYTYDNDNRLTGSAGVSLAYDGAGRLISSNGLAITRDAVGRIGSVTYPPGKITYSYESRGLLSQISDWTGGTVSFQFNAAHQLTSISRSNGVMTQYTYDQDGRVVSITDTSNGAVFVSIHLTRDAIGRVTSANRILPQEATPGAPGALPLGVNAANQIAGFTYDARGRLTQGDAGSTYTWNPASRLVSYTRSDGSASCTYDGLGQRVSRTGADGTTLNYVLNYATGLPSVAVVQSGNSDETYYIYAPDGSLLYSIDATTGSRHFYSFDETGSTTLLTDDSGAVTDTYGISSYGDVITAGASNKTVNPFTWQGQWGVMQEPGTSLFYLRFRYYDSAFARFLSRDPLFSPAPREINSYQYAAGNPVANGDPAGLKTGNFPSFGVITEYSFNSLHSSSMLAADLGIPIANTTTDLSDSSGLRHLNDLFRDQEAPTSEFAPLTSGAAADVIIAYH